MSGTCEIHGVHRPGVVTVNHHHILPLGMGGPDTKDNQVVICPTGHANVHAAMAALVFSKPMPKVARNELKLAKMGYQKWIDAGKPGNPHAAYAMVLES